MLRYIACFALVVVLVVELSGCAQPRVTGKGEVKLTAGLTLTTDAVKPAKEKKVWTGPETEIAKMVQEMLVTKQFVSMHEAFAKNRASTKKK